MSNNKPHQLTETSPGRFVLHYDTFDDTTSQLISRTHLIGSLPDIVNKLITTHREAIFCIARSNRKIRMLEQQLQAAGAAVLKETPDVRS
jgi:hypothetical protein